MPPTLDLTHITAPMVSHSDLPFRLLTTTHGASLTYTQMLDPLLLSSDPDYLAFHLRDLQCSRKLQEGGRGRGVVVQLCGNEAETVREGARRVAGWADAVDLNLGCPQQHAKDGHYGAYLLGQKDWPLIESIVSTLAHTLPVPVSAKLRLCHPAPSTLALGRRLEAAGAAWVALHARYASVRRRRQGVALLGEVRRLKGGDSDAGVGGLGIPVLSNGNVRCYEDVERNLEETGADGVMVGETLLGNPCLFDKTGVAPDPVLISLEYLELCREFGETVTLGQVQTHVRRFVGFGCARRPWYQKFRARLGDTKSVDEIERLLRFKVQRWRGAAVLGDGWDEAEEDEEDEGESREEGDELGWLDD
ncbi:FMN-linked oxidoreductase [Heliocybe sulcata]|uniref:tRNA-dihydrouridine synthase n=1 Tax=Heliocybe sulcata TaxID=5364 RepID=A0A5C3MV98_9AGAM|nr:FMN-linked oxidoreductase [Heliocybe sulcata]